MDSIKRAYLKEIRDFEVTMFNENESGPMFSSVLTARPPTKYTAIK